MRIALVLFIAVLLASCGNGDGAERPPPYVVVANLGSGTLSVIDTDFDAVVRTVTLPPAAAASTPGYLAYSPSHRQLYVGDGANRRIVVYQVPGFYFIGDMPVPADVFHMWANDRQLWATDRDAFSILVFDLVTNTPIATLPMPADLRALGGEPHDVVADSSYAYVTFLGIDSAPHVVVQYSCDTLMEVGRASVGEDPHVLLHPTSNELYVACQGTDEVFVLDRKTLAPITVVPIFGGHGVWIPPHGQTLYVTNFPSHIVGGDPGPGALGIFAVDLATNTAIGGVETSQTRAHNLTSTADGRKLYVTHSNRFLTKVGVYDLPDPGSTPVFLREIEVGRNPFGIVRLQ